jgi:hypothetical protein
MEVKMLKLIRSVLVLFSFSLYFLIMHGAVFAAEKGAPAPPKGLGSVTGVQGGFRLVAYSNAVNQLAKDVCTKSSEVKDSNNRGIVTTCYGYEWQDWVRKAFSKKTKRFGKAIVRDVGVMVPATSVLEYPDGSNRLVFGACRQHACPEAQVFMLVDPKEKDMDIIWRSGAGTEYIGQNGEILKQNKIFDLLWNNWADL